MTHEPRKPVPRRGREPDPHEDPRHRRSSPARPAPLHHIETLAAQLDDAMAEWAMEIRQQMMCRLFCVRVATRWGHHIPDHQCYRAGERRRFWRFVPDDWPAARIEKRLHAAEASRAA